jgi:hypothetical protein
VSAVERANDSIDAAIPVVLGLLVVFVIVYVARVVLLAIADGSFSSMRSLLRLEQEEPYDEIKSWDDVKPCTICGTRDLDHNEIIWRKHHGTTNPGPYREIEPDSDDLPKARW